MAIPLKGHQSECYRQLSAWLSLRGQPVACLEGFSGTGKTLIARTLLQESDAGLIPIMFEMKEGQSNDDFLISLMEELHFNGIKTLDRAFDQGNLNLATLGFLFREKVLLILDEFQWLLEGNRPQKGWKNLLSTLANRNLPGKLLLLTNRGMERAKWSHEMKTIQLKPWNEDQGVAYLRELLEERGFSHKIPQVRHLDLARTFGSNPRALKILVESLDADDLDDLVSITPEAWSLEDQRFDRRLLEKLERELLERILARLDRDRQFLLRVISVHRYPIKKDAYKKLIGDQDWQSLRRDLIRRYLVDHEVGQDRAHPVVRDVLIHRDGDPMLREAHNLAADYHRRHFGKNIVKTPAELGRHYVEACYHLLRCNRNKEIKGMLQRFEQHLVQCIRLVTPVPSNKAELENRIQFLSAFLQDRGPHVLAYHLARCFIKRDQPGDKSAALEQMRYACGPLGSDQWRLRIQLEGELHGPQSALECTRQALELIPAEMGAEKLYISCAQILANHDEKEEAITLLKEGIGQLPHPFLYQACGEILSRMGREEEAVTLLRDGIAKLPTSQPLYHACGEILLHMGREEEAFTLLRDGIAKVPAAKNLFSLYQACGEILSRMGREEEAVTLLRDGIAKLPTSQPLYQACGEILSRMGREEEAVTLLREGIGRVPADKNLQALYSACSRILLFFEKADMAFSLLIDGFKQHPELARNHTLVPHFLLSAMDQGSRSAIKELLNSSRFTQSSKTLGQLCLLILDEQWQQLATQAHAARLDCKVLYFHEFEAFALLCLGQPQMARDALKSYGPIRPGFAQSWLLALIETKAQNEDKAREYFIEAGFEIGDQQQVDLPLLLKVWDESPTFSGPADPAYFFPILPPMITGLPETVRRDRSSKTVLPDWVKQGSKRESSEKPSFLFLATEWSSGKGGLSTLNRELCIALASAGHRVYCVALEVSPDDIANAKACGVELSLAPLMPGMSEEARLLQVTPPEHEGQVWICGHDRITGSQSTALAGKGHWAGHLLLFHTIPDEIEYLKDDTRDATRSAEMRTRLQTELALNADVVVGVGPKITEALEYQLSGYPDKRPSLLRMDPGLSPLEDSYQKSSGTLSCLVMGRMDDQRIKGLDIAVRALGKLQKHKVRVVVRGSQPGQGDDLRKQLQMLANNPNISIVTREYSSDLENIQADLRRAHLVLMPSRKEGFGLVGMEALSMGTPVLISDQSGLGQFLQETGGEAADFVVPVVDDLEQDAMIWEREIDIVLRNPEAAGKRVRKVYPELAQVLCWKRAAKALLMAISSRVTKP